MASGIACRYADWRLEGVRATVQVEALLCTRVLAVRVAAEHLTALWPVAMAELQRVLLAPLEARPALLLAACQLVDTLLAVLPDTFSPFGWMFVPGTAPHAAGAVADPAAGDAGALSFEPQPAAPAAPYQQRRQHSPVLLTTALPPAITSAVSSAPFDFGGETRRFERFEDDVATAPSSAPSPAPSSASPPRILAEASTRVPPAEFAALLEPLAQLASPTTAPPPRGGGLLRPSADGRRRPSLGMRALSHASELAPFASNLHRHLAASAILPRCAEVDLPLLEVLLGCEFVAPNEAEAMLAPHLLATLEGGA